MIYAPFNFVPLSEKVFFPNWASDISQDIPFSDGLSGELRIRIKSITPIFVRNGHTPDDKEHWTDDFIEFSHTPDGRYFIPATSIKGMVRNIIEICSFGKMSRITPKRYSIRDLYMKSYTNYFRNHEVHCGWMIVDKQKGTATITDHGIPGRISADEIDSKLHIGLSDFVHETKKRNLTKTINRYAKAKYELLSQKKDISLEGRFIEYSDEDDNNKDNRIKVQFSSTGKLGTIVFTGQPGRRSDKIVNSQGEVVKKASGKFYEFVFFENVLRTFEIPLEEGNVYNDFDFIHKDSEDWKYWQKQGKTPIFFTLDSRGEIEYMGLSYMFKLPTKKHIKEFLSEKHRSLEYDLAECIFGTIGESSLKGRVQFSNAFCCTDHPQVGDVIKPYMGSPKPSYYPIYTQQKGQDGHLNKDSKYKTFLEDDAKLRGWKKYPVRSKTSTVGLAGEGQEKNTNPFKPIKEGTEFVFVIRYHNLRKVELGALLFGLSPFDNCLFSLGFCKPYGYGVVSMEICNMEKEEINHLKESFVALMNAQIDHYEQSPQLLELRAMMMISGENPNYPLKYMNGPKEFSNQKNNLFYLQDYSKIRIQTAEELAYEKKLREEAEERRVAMEKAAEEAAEKARQAADLAEEERRKAEIQAEKDRKLNSGFDSFINEVYTAGPNVGKYKVTSFKTCESKCHQWLKLNKRESLIDIEKEILSSVFTRLKNSPDKKERKLWENKDSQIWKAMRKWLGEDWHGELFK